MQLLISPLGVQGLGGVFRDHTGLFLHGFRHSVMIANSAKHAELLALLLGVQTALEHHLTPLIVETDCLELVTALSSSSLDQSDLGFLLADLRELLHEALDARVLRWEDKPMERLISWRKMLRMLILSWNFFQLFLRLWRQF